MVFAVQAANFTDPLHGWVIGQGAGLQLRRTVNGGKTWLTVSSPPATDYWYSGGAQSPVVGDLRFTDAHTGYLFGPDLLMTSDGGRSWSTLKPRDVTHLVIVGQWVIAVTQTSTGPPTVMTAAIGSDVWTRRVFPAGPDGTNLSAAGSSVLLLVQGKRGARQDVTPVYDGRLWFSTDQARTWRARAVPCTPTDGGAANAALASSDPRTWLVDCYDGRQSQQEQHTVHHLYRSTDSGRTWRRLADPSHQGTPAGIADNGHRTLATVTESGAGDVLHVSTDGGRSWRAALTFEGFTGWSDLAFLTPTIAIVVGPTRSIGPPPGSQPHLYRTGDGATWTKVIDTLTH